MLEEHEKEVKEYTDENLYLFYRLGTHIDALNICKRMNELIPHL